MTKLMKLDSISTRLKLPMLAYPIHIITCSRVDSILNGFMENVLKEQKWIEVNFMIYPGK